MSVFSKGDKIPIEGGRDAVVTSDGRMTEEEWMGRWFQPLIDAGVKQKTLCEVFHHDHRQLKRWSAEVTDR